jgi:pimeloyl-ACP methyl ester carboxylesterase
MRRRDFIKALASSTTAWPLAALAQHRIPATTRAYVMNGLYVGTGLATIAGRLRARGYIVAYGSYTQDRAFAADACAHPADRIVVVGHSFGAEAAARVATQAAACGAHDVIMIGVDPAAPSEVRGVSHAVNFVGEYRGTIAGARNIPVPGYTHMGIMESPTLQERILSEVGH